MQSRTQLILWVTVAIEGHVDPSPKLVYSTTILIWPKFNLEIEGKFEQMGIVLKRAPRNDTGLSEKV